ncbi:YeiH family protein [Extensimonas vulgaris]|uniref:Putative integral membrane protein (TIGR00698 family) n=1 Tax=Extensimonas vulgaris TaxID=1031594 RepID=A0A369AHV6_9BURK|nr:YeiH family protein [Extensimonas vulgaris]RCX08959.1 putative integral membrane protein (TIGR00698 family) [Extensimonas vulgaris]TWI37195.1 putative integral membrane protein (TIGR00698 family) [Extensimonas vulgaris]TXD14317.1 YeiH family putative sulfate export transporter [Extensimonas vulgaris]
MPEPTHHPVSTPPSPWMRPLRQRAPGLVLTLVLALAAAWLAQQPWVARWGLSALTLAIVGGIVLGNTVYPALQTRCGMGVDYAKQRLLRLGIILFGLRITLQQMGQVGWSGVLIDVIMLTSTFGLAVWLGRWLRIDGQTAILIGAGSSICGAAAVLATEPVLQARGDKVAVAVATVMVFGTLGMFGYPLLHPWLASLGAGDAAYGVYVGSTVHEVAQVVGAGRAVSETAADHAVITKMIRVMLLAPFLLALSWAVARRGVRVGARAPVVAPITASGPTADASARSRITIPWFALGFVLVALLNSLPLLPAAPRAMLLALDNLLLAMAMGALGLSTHASAIRRAGSRPLALAALLFVWLVLGGGLVNALLGHWGR